jgi:hypothetical protein
MIVMASSFASPTTEISSVAPRTSKLVSWATSLVLGGVVFGVYVVNGRELGTNDTAPTIATAVCLYRGDGLYVDRFLDCWGLSLAGNLPPCLARWRGHVISRYPIAPALLALPVAALSEHHFNWLNPGWDRTALGFYQHVLAMGKLAAALIATLTAVMLHRVLTDMGFARVAIPATLAGALGSELWMVGSQALWQHGPAALALITAVWLLLPRDPSRTRLALAGVAVAALVACRVSDALFALVITGWMARAHPRRLVWFLPAPVLGAVALGAWNLWLYGAIAGGQVYLESLHPILHGLPAGAWSGSLLAGAAGTFFSPSHGLLVFTPWVGLALAVLPFSAQRLAPWPVVRWLLWALVPFGAMFSKYTVWWGGHCFGPRYWTDVMPLLAIVLASGLDWAYERRRVLVLAFALAIIVSIGVQAIGAFCYNSSWNLKPANVDLHHERLWDWRDTPLTRCLINGPVRLEEAPGRASIRRVIPGRRAPGRPQPASPIAR